MKFNWKRALPASIGGATGATIALVIKDPGWLLEWPSFFLNWLFCFAVTYVVLALLLGLFDRRKKNKQKDG